MPPSCKLIFKTLEYEGPVTQEGLAEASKLSSRTVRYALRMLEDERVITQEVYLPDARQRLYQHHEDLIEWGSHLPGPGMEWVTVSSGPGSGCGQCRPRVAGTRASGVNRLQVVHGPIPT